jgi:hypothetical protein
LSAAGEDGRSSNAQATILLRGGVTDESARAALPPPAKPGTSAPPLSAEARQMLERALLASLDASV